jgi:flagellar basal-body rod protein FlgC
MDNTDFLGFDVSASGLTAQRLRMDVIANNIANVDTTRTPEGGPYKRQEVIFESRLKELMLSLPMPRDNQAMGDGVRVAAIVEDNSLPILVYNPGHPDANADGYVAMPNVNPVTEMVDMISASRAYEANIKALQSAKEMAVKALDIISK